MRLYKSLTINFHCMAPVKRRPYFVFYGIIYISGLSGSSKCMQPGEFENSIPLKPVLGSVDSVVPFIAANEQSDSNLDCTYYSSIASYASGISYHQNLFRSIKSCRVI